ncbi:hypothetical protein K8R03_04265 [Candidatus Kaiserbacteria bacterium]|nr:hypothetical protein [Candidatus Kaiserbacteria bacterium]
MFEGRAVTAVALLFAVVFGGAGYVWYRYNSASVISAATSHLASDFSLRDVLQIVHGKPATICRTSASNFSASAQKVAYIADDMMRIDYSDVSSGLTKHTLLTPDGFFVWDSDSDSAIVIGLDTLLGAGTADNTGAGAALRLDEGCEPWWNADTSVFKVPANLLLEDLRG